MVKPRITTRGGVNFNEIAQAIPEEVGRTLVRGAQMMVFDNTTKIKQGRDLQGRVQKQNTFAVRRQKLSNLGHGIPLIGESRILSNPTFWRINGVSATSPHLIASRTGRVRVDLPIRRAHIVRFLERKGYRVPFGLTARLARQISQMLGPAMARVASLGARPGDLSPFQIRAFIGRQLGRQR